MDGCPGSPPSLIDLYCYSFGVTVHMFKPRRSRNRRPTGQADLGKNDEAVMPLKSSVRRQVVVDGEAF
jgi:hypothetical protein